LGDAAGDALTALTREDARPRVACSTAACFLYHCPQVLTTLSLAVCSSSCGWLPLCNSLLVAPSVALAAPPSGNCSSSARWLQLPSSLHHQGESSLPPAGEWVEEGHGGQQESGVVWKDVGAAGHWHKDALRRERNCSAAPPLEPPTAPWPWRPHRLPTVKLASPEAAWAGKGDGRS
jgi:hypothetical protein